MRIHRIGIRDYKGVDAELPVGSALVLFGPNDGGKTNVLEAIATMLGAQDTVREEPGWREDERHVDLSLLVELDGLEVPGHPDERCFLAWTAPDLLERATSADTKPKERADRRARLSGYVRSVRHRHGDDGLRSRWFRIGKRDLLDSGSRVEWLAPSPLLPDGWRGAPAIGDFHTPHDPVSGATWLGAGDAAMAALHERFERHLERLPEYACRDYHDEDSFCYVATAPVEPWLESQGENDVRNPLIVDACEKLSDRASDLAPQFLSRAYRLLVEPLAASEWRTYRGRHIVFLLERRADGTLFHLDVMSHGLQAWAAYALLEAIREAEDEFAARYDLDTELDRRPDTLLYLFDEPEAHLHPLAQEEAARWITDRVKSGPPIVLASHALPFLDLPLQDAQYVRITRSDAGHTTAETVTGDVLGAIDEAGLELGIPPAAVIQLTRAWLVVEGEHDREVLNLYHGPELSEARVRILPLRGATRAKASFLNLEALGGLGIPFVCLLDNVRFPIVDNSATPDKPTEEEKIAGQIRRLQDRGVDVEVMGLPYPDIVCVLPIEAVRRVALAHGSAPEPELSWEALISAHREQQLKHRGSIKTLVRESLGLTNMGDDDFFKELLEVARDCAPADKELPRIVQSVVARVSERTWSAPGRETPQVRPPM